MSRTVPVFATAILAVIVHTAFLMIVWPNIVATSEGNFDARQYRELADSVRAGEGFALDRPGHGRGPDLSRTPGYPVFLALFGSGWDTALPTVAAQHLLVLAVAFLMYRWVRRQGLPEAAATTVFALVALDLTTMTYASYLLTETLFTLLLWAAFAAWPRPEDDKGALRAIAAGLFWALATLTRPITLYMLPGFALVAAMTGRRRPTVLKRVAIASLVGLLGVSIWYVRNFALSGRLVFSTIEGENLLHYRAALVSLPDGVSIEAWRSALRERTHEARYNLSVPSEAAALDLERKRLAMRLIFENMLQVYRPIVVGLPRLLVAPNRTYFYRLIGVEHDEWQLTAERASFSPSLGWELPYLLASTGYQILLCLACALGVARVMKKREWGLVALLFVLVYLAALSTGLETHSRFRVPLLPGMAVLASYGIVSLAPWWKRLSARKWVQRW